MILTINGKQAALKKGSSIEYVSENRIFTDADDYHPQGRGPGRHLFQKGFRCAAKAT